MSSFRRPLKVQMPDRKGLVKGQTVIGEHGDVITIRASVQPPSAFMYDSVKVGLGDARIDRVILVTTGAETRLPVADPHTGAEPCFFLWQNRRYRNMMVREGLAGVIPHMQYWAVQEQEGINA
jgi:hypothetical protein